MTAKHKDIMPPPADFDPDTPLTDAEFERGRAAYLARQAARLSRTRKAYGLHISPGMLNISPPGGVSGSKHEKG